MSEAKSYRDRFRAERRDHMEIYYCWKAMKQRCLNPNNQAYHNYGARGITLCPEWMKFEPFLEWALSAGWQKGLDLDRIDNDGNYEPTNCRWTTRQVNTNNRRMTKYLTVHGETLPESDWARKSGVNRGTIESWRLKHGREYAEMRLADAIENGYTQKYNPNCKGVAIVLLETGEVFKSAGDAGRAVGLDRHRVLDAAKKKHAVHGWHFRIYHPDENEKKEGKEDAVQD